MSLLLTQYGTPIINKNGKFIEIEEFDSFKQRIWNLFNTQLGTDLLFPDYGFDMLSIVRADPADRERAIYSYTVNALNPDNVSGLYEVKDITISYETGVGYIDITVMSDFGQIITTNFEVNIDEL